MPVNSNSKDSALVSIIMPAFNAEKYIGQSIQSVMAQSHKNWEMLIVDDGSTDNTAAVIKRYAEKDNRIKYIYQKNQRQGTARNNGIRNSSGRILAFIDSDDLWRPEKITRQLEVLFENEADLIFSDGYYFRRQPGDMQQGFKTKIGKHSGIQAIDSFITNNRVVMSSVLVKKEAVESVGGFHEDPTMHVEDYHLWMKMLLNGAVFMGVPDRLMYYRLHAEQFSVADAWGSEGAFYMFSRFLEFPTGLLYYKKKAKLRWAYNWYARNAKTKQQGRDILQRIQQVDQMVLPCFLSRLVLQMFGLTASRYVMRKTNALVLKIDSKRNDFSNHLQP